MAALLSEMYTGLVISALLYRLGLTNHFSVAAENWKDRTVTVTCQGNGLNVSWDGDLHKLVQKLGPDAQMKTSFTVVDQKVLITIVISYVTFPTRPNPDTEVTTEDSRLNGGAKN